MDNSQPNTSDKKEDTANKMQEENKEIIDIEGGMLIEKLNQDSQIIEENTEETPDIKDGTIKEE